MAESHLGARTAGRGAPRLTITKIVNENFKSYAGKCTLGPFHKSFTSIVGPNGSGKSNVIDAMLFVFGYRASKIRSKKISILIHNSDRHKNLQNCTVTVHFQKIIDLPGDDFEPISGSEFTVSRTASRDNSSHYTIDGRRVPFKEVSALLRREGIDLDHNRFLILQGEVELISQMKPKAPSVHEDGMLEYLEDIVGSSAFKEPIEGAAKELEEIVERRGEKLTRVKIMEKEIDQLEEAKDEAVEFIKMENEITRKRHVLLQRYMLECAEEEKKGIEVKQKMVEERVELEEKLKEAVNRRTEMAKKSERDVKAFDQLNEAMDKAKAAFSQCERRDVKLREDLKHSKEKDKKTKKALAKEGEKLEDLRKAPEKNQEEINRLEALLPPLEAKKVKEDAKLKEVLASLKDATLDLQNKKEVEERMLLQKQEVVNEMKSKFTVAKAELDLLTGQYRRHEEELQKAKEDLTNATDTVKEKSSELSQFKKELPSCRKQITEAEKELATATQREGQLSTKVKKFKMKVNEEKSSMQASQSRGRVLGALLEQKRLGRIEGIHGRLGDLGTIDDRYDVAISTACGPLDFIVVDTMDIAVKCVEFLKKNGLGIATFIGLDKMQKWAGKASQKISTPENVPRLFDLIRFKDKMFAPAFYFSLRDTLLANDLEQATRIAYKGTERHRVVTLKGELIDISGTMSGGGKRFAKGRMSSKMQSDMLSAADLRKMESEVDAGAKELEALQDRKAELESQLTELRARVGQIEHEIKKCTIDVEGSQLQVTELKKRIPELEAELRQLVPDPQKVKKLEKNVKSLEEKLKKVDEDAGVTRNEVQRLHDQIMEITSTRVQSQQAKVDQVTGEIDSAKSQITKAKVAIKTAERNFVKSEKKVKSLEEDKEQTTEKMKKIHDDLKSLEEEAGSLLDKADRAQEEVEVYAKRVEAMQQEMGIVEKAENEIKVQLVDIKHTLQTTEGRVADNQRKVKTWKKELDKMVLQSLALDGEELEELKKLTDEELTQVDTEAIQYEISLLQEKKKEMKPNMAAVEEYRKKEKVYLNRVEELESVTKEKEEVRHRHEDLCRQRLEAFMAGFTFITSKLKEMYQMITLGGDAELELVDSLDPFSEGIVFSVRPPKKSWKNICNLSGGEKTLSSLALVFALHQYKPSPLYVMDEIDAALDVKNVSIVGHYIKERTKNAQFIIISLRPNMYELSNRVVGIYKVSDCTNSVTINTPPPLATVA